MKIYSFRLALSLLLLRDLLGGWWLFLDVSKFVDCTTLDVC